MRIALDARPLQDGYKTHAHRGIGAFARSLYEALGRHARAGDAQAGDARVGDARVGDARAGDARDTFMLVCDPAFPAPHEFPFETIALPAPSRAGRITSGVVPWERGRRFEKLPCDAIYFPHYEDAPWGGAGPARFVTVHDCIPFRDDTPYGSPPFARSVRALMAKRILRAGNVASISLATRDDLVRLFGIGHEDVALLPPAPHPQFLADARAGDPATRNAMETGTDAIDALQLPANFVLATGGADPRKRNAALVRAWPQVDASLALVIAGSPTRPEWERTLAASIETSRAHDRIRRLPRLPFAALPELYRRASALAFLSTHEGFGLPVLEAMACGVPVVAAREPAVEEAAGDAVLWIGDRFDTAELVAAIRAVTDDGELRADLRARGFARAAEHSWDTTAETLVNWIRDHAARRRALPRQTRPS